MRYFKADTILDRIRAAKLSGFRHKTLRGFRDWQNLCSQKAQSISAVTECCCTQSMQSQFAAGIQKQLELAYSGRFIGARTFGRFRRKVVRDPMFLEWEIEDMRMRAQKKLCHTTRHGFSCYCDESDHVCPQLPLHEFFQRER